MKAAIVVACIVVLLVCAVLLFVCGTPRGKDAKGCHIIAYPWQEPKEATKTEVDRLYAYQGKLLVIMAFPFALLLSLMLAAIRSMMPSL